MQSRRITASSRYCALWRARDNAHCRRYFFEAALCRYPAGLQGLLRVRAIYAADRVLRRAPADERKALRAQHVQPLVDDFFARVHATKADTPGRNLATKALGYATNQEAELRRILDSGDLPLDNTRAERALRKIVMRGSLCISLSSTWKPECAVVSGFATRAFDTAA